LPAPEGDLPLQDLTLQPGALPSREVRVLYRRLRQGGRSTVRERGVEGREVADEDLHRPAVTNDVMQGQRDDMIPLGQPQQHAAQQRPTREVERATGLLPDQGEGQRLSHALRQPHKIHQGQREGCRRLDHLHRRALQ
jgi:hypothetical protein